MMVSVDVLSKGVQHKLCHFGPPCSSATGWINWFYSNFA